MDAAKWRDLVPSVLVSTLSSAFGVALLGVTGALSEVIADDEATGASGYVATALPIAAAVFIAVAVYVGAVVTANSFSTIIAGRVRLIALLRLVGSSARRQRRAVATEGLIVGTAGSVLGIAIGTGVAAGVLAIGRAAGVLDGSATVALSPVQLIPALFVVVTTWLAAWVGARKVLTVSPIDAIGAAATDPPQRVRQVPAILAIGIGSVLLCAGVVIGLVDPAGVLVALVGGLVSFSGIVVGARMLLPPVIRLTGAAFGSSAPARLAAANAIRYPERTARATVGVVIGVTLITMFAVAVESFQRIIAIARAAQPEVYQGVGEVLTATVVVFSVLVGFSGLIAAVGLVNTLSLSVLQRRRELGLLRALGFTAPQVGRMVLIESAQLVATSVIAGLLLGTFYGWAGAQALLGSGQGVPGLVMPAVPVVLLAIVAAAAVVLTLAASVVPIRRATRLTPVAALAVD